MELGTEGADMGFEPKAVSGSQASMPADTATAWKVPPGVLGLLLSQRER